MNLQEMGRRSGDSIDVVHREERKRAVVYTVMNLQAV